MKDADVIALLAGGAVLVFEADRTGAELVTRHASITADQLGRLNRQGWLKSFPNFCGASLSDAGRVAYFRSTDELQDGALVPPRAALPQDESHE